MARQLSRRGEKFVMKMHEDNLYIFLDIETTGLDLDKDEIIEIGMVAANQDTETSRFHTLVKPTVSIPTRIVSLTGLTDDMFKHAPAIEEVRDDVLKFIGNYPIIGHNISFDVNFLERKFGCRLSNRQFDTVNLAHVAFPTAPSFRLELIAKMAGISGNRSHRALDDAESAKLLFWASFNILKQLDHQTFMQIFRVLESKDWFFAKTLISILKPSVLSFAENKIKDSFTKDIADPAPEESLFATPEPDQDKKAQDIKGLLNFFDRDGAFAKDNPGYRFRPTQVEMMETVLAGFRDGSHMVVEGGTGTGKSLAYLVPAVAWALAEKAKVVLATHTINLQEQLWEKDIPWLRETAGINYRAALVKGRSNYICLNRWNEKLKKCSSISHNETVFVLKIIVWLSRTETGDKSELNIQAWQSGYWNDISSDQDLCIGPACKWYNRQCFVSRARKAADMADILVVNHSLLLIDLKLKNKLLPAYEYLIIDEAHHLEESATQQLGWVVDINQLRAKLLSMNVGFGKGPGPGILSRLKLHLAGGSGEPQMQNRSAGSETSEHVSGILEAAAAAVEFLHRWSKENGAGFAENALISARIRESDRRTETWQIMSTVIGNLSFRIGSFCQYLNKNVNLLESLKQQREAKTEPMVKELGFCLKYFEEVFANLNQLIKGEANAVLWIQNTRDPAGIQINSAPINVNNILREVLFQSKKSILLTSATLSVQGSFDHFTERIGLSEAGGLITEQKQVVKRVFSSPFAYEEQSLMCVVRDLPDPSGVSDEEYAEAAAAVIDKLARIFDGHTLVLFTSHKMLQTVYHQVKPGLEAEGITILGHLIDGGRSRLAEEFRKGGRTVLFGASSFWEGVDIPGQALQCVVVVKLPFSPPNSPVVEARNEELTNRNLDAFYNYSVPGAVIKMKQGFGRLIRSEEDEGVVVVLDRRIIDRKYGHRFLKSLPVRTYFKGDSETVLQKISDWVQGERSPAVSSLNILQNIGDIEEYLKMRG